MGRRLLSTKFAFINTWKARDEVVQQARDLRKYTESCKDAQRQRCQAEKTDLDPLYSMEKVFALSCGIYSMRNERSFG